MWMRQGMRVSAYRSRVDRSPGASRKIFRDESIYGPEPQIYNPERFLKDGKLDPSVMDPEGRISGTGRRWEL